MIKTAEVIKFFDRLAPGWDENLVRDEEKINRILYNARVFEGSTVLDVACGTGVMIPYYLKRNVASVTAVDISPEMARIAGSKFPQENVEVLCADVEKTDFGKRFDSIVVYNAFPHFPDPERLIKRLSGLLAPGGTLTVAHGSCREDIDAHHKGCASHVSNGLMSAEDLAKIFGRYLKVTAVISDERMYQVAGRL